MAGIPSRFRSTGTFLTVRRKDLIRNFKKLDMGPPGSKEWCLKLFEYMREKDDEVTFPDVQRWVVKHPWITCSEFETRSSVRHTSVREPHQTQPVSQVSPTTTTEAPLPEQTFNGETYFMQEDSGTVASPPQLAKQLFHGPSGLHSNPPMPQPVPKVVSSHLQEPIPSPVNSTQDGAREMIAAGVQDQKLTEEYYHCAFNAINMLNEICSQMPAVRVCLRPLKEIHRCFVRSHARFIFPNEYESFRAMGTEDGSIIKVDTIDSTTADNGSEHETICVEDDMTVQIS